MKIGNLDLPGSEAGVVHLTEHHILIYLPSKPHFRWSKSLWVNDQMDGQFFGRTQISSEPF